MKKLEKYQVSLEKAKQSLGIADHMTYVTYPVVKENKLLLKVLEEINQSLIGTINAILQYEYLYKRIQIYKDAKENFKTFKKLTSKYQITQEQFEKIKEIITLARKHQKSPLEFSKNNKLVIMSDNNKPSTITIEKIKNYLLEAKDTLRKTENEIKK